MLWFNDKLLFPFLSICFLTLMLLAGNVHAKKPASVFKAIDAARAAGAASINAHRPTVIAACREPRKTWRQLFMTYARRSKSCERPRMTDDRRDDRVGVDRAAGIAEP